MMNRLINGLAFVTLIAMALIGFGCLDTNMLPEDILTDLQEPTFDPLPAGEGLSIGETAPAFSLPDADGNLHALSNFEGKKVALVFFATSS